MSEATARYGPNILYNSIYKISNHLNQRLKTLIFFNFPKILL